MDFVRRLASILLVVFAVMCMAAWAHFVNGAAFAALANVNPIQWTQFPGENPFLVILGFAFGALGLAYVVYPPAQRAHDDD